MKRIAAFLALAFALSICGAFAHAGAYSPQDDNWNYGSGNYRWDRSWNSRPDPRDGACFYSSAGFRGNRFCVRAGDQIPHLPSGYGDNISSIQIFGRAGVRFFNDSNYRNGGVALTGQRGGSAQVPFRDGTHGTTGFPPLLLAAGVRCGQRRPATIAAAGQQLGLRISKQRLEPIVEPAAGSARRCLLLLDRALPGKPFLRESRRPDSESTLEFREQYLVDPDLWAGEGPHFQRQQLPRRRPNAGAKRAGSAECAVPGRTHLEQPHFVDHC